MMSKKVSSIMNLIYCNKLLIVIGITLFLVFNIGNNNLHASHIVGGEMTYRCLGKFGSIIRLEVRLTLRRDCLLGSPEAEFDNPANIGIFDSEGNILRELGRFGVFEMKLRNDDTLNEILKTECDVIGGDVCVHTTTYVERIDLPFKKGGYLLAYQRCCRNMSISNIMTPELVGATYTVRITEEALNVCNSSPRFLDWPPIYICSDRAVTFNHAVTDVDGDSIVYSLCAPYVGADTANSKPSIPKAPFTTVVYRPPFSLFNLIGGSPALEIERKTGVITGQPMPNIVGQYLIGVCVNEYRNGKLLSQVRRDFQYNVRICTTNPVANFSADKDNICDEDRLVTFTNKSINSQEYRWFFNYPTNTFTSQDTNPKFLFPKSGIYNVLLVTKRDKGCIDSSMQAIYVYDSTLLGARFDFNISSCDDSIKLNFSDKSFDSLRQLNNWNWEITLNGKRYISTKRNPDFIIPDTGEARIRLVVTSVGGCKDTLSKLVSLNRLKPGFPETGLPICIGDSTKIISSPDKRFKYEWTPATDITCTDCPDPIVFPKKNTVYRVKISDGLCSAEDSVLIKVSDLLDIDIAGDKVICSDSVVLNAIGGVESTIQWSSNNDFSNIIQSGSFVLNTSVNKTGKFFVRGKSNSNCPGLDSITISNEKVQVDFTGNNYRFCEQDTFTVSINNRDPNHQLIYTWSPSDKIILGQGSATIKALSDSCESFKFKITAKNQFNCSADAEVNVELVCKPNVDFNFNKNCDNTFVSFINTSANGIYMWDFGDNTTSTEKNPIHDFGRAGKYKVTLKIDAECDNEITKFIDVGFIPVQLNDTILSCFGQPVPLNPSPDLSYKYEWSPPELVSDPNSPNPFSKSNTTTVYKVRVIDPNIADCFIERTVTVFIPPAINLEVNSDTVLCDPDTITLSARTNIIAKIEWLDGIGLFLGDGYSIKKFFRDSQFVYAYATDIYGCTYRDSFKVVPINPSYEIKGDSNLCPGKTGFIEFVQKDRYKYKFNWKPSGAIVGTETSNRIITKPTDTTLYTLQFENEYGCIYNDSFIVAISKFQDSLRAWTDQDTIYLGDTTSLHVTPGYPPYKWVNSNPERMSCDDCEDPKVWPKISTSYIVYATDASGCVGERTVSVFVRRPVCNEEDVFLPNIFSPNNDNNNDELKLRSNFVTQLDLYIYDRWGEKVYESHDPNFMWDGTYKGAELKPDVYAYYFKAVCIDGQNYSEKGNVTIIR